MPNIKVPIEERHLYTPDEVAQMIEKAPTLKDKSLIAFYYIFGVREKEPFYIKREDIWVDDEWFYVKVKREKVPKGVILPKIDTLQVKLDTIFLDYIIEQFNNTKEGEFVWFYHSNLETARIYVWKMIKKTNPNAWIHLFRHTRNDYFRRKGKTREQRMAWFGWTDVRTPDKHYSHPDERDIKEMGSEIE